MRALAVYLWLGLFEALPYEGSCGLRRVCGSQLTLTLSTLAPSMSRELEALRVAYLSDASALLLASSGGPGSDGAAQHAAAAAAASLGLRAALAARVARVALPRRHCAACGAALDVGVSCAVRLTADSSGARGRPRPRLHARCGHCGHTARVPDRALSLWRP